MYLVEVYIQYQTLAGKGIPGIPLSFQPVCHGGKQVALQLINKLEVLWLRPERMQRSKEKCKCCREHGHIQKSCKEETMCFS